MSLKTLQLEMAQTEGSMALGKFWGQIKKASGMESKMRSPQFEKVTHRVIVRATQGCRPRPRQQFRAADNALLAIKAVIDRDGRGRSFVCLCEAQ